MPNSLSNSYVMPAEWEPHEAVWLAWPHDEITFPNRIAKVEDDVTQIIKAIHQSEMVELLVVDEVMKNVAIKKLQTAGVNLDRVRFRIMDYMDAWMRDCGPIFVKDANDKLHLTKWIFNCWGGKFMDLDKDKFAPERVSEWLKMDLISVPLVLEGGAIDVNGQGACLTTEQCLLNPNRNPGKTKAEVEKYLADYLGINKTIWLKEGLYKDHTDGHIDELARFVSPTKVLCAFEDNPKDENYHILQTNYEMLKRDFEVVKLPMPHMYYDSAKPFEAGEKAPASYTNFYIGNTVVLAATFNDPNDKQALEIIQACFPDRKVVDIDCSDIIYGGGGVHCMTQQQPAA